jgi:hypothetical protein
MSDVAPVLATVPAIGWVCSVCGHVWRFAVTTCTCGYAPEWIATQTARGDDDGAT